MKKRFLMFLIFSIYLKGFSQNNYSEKIYFNEKDSLDIGISSEIKLGSLLIQKKFKKLISKKFKEPYGQKYLSFYNNKNICTVLLFPTPNNYFIRSFDLIQNNKINKTPKDFINCRCVFKTNQFNISLNDSLHSVIDKLLKANITYEKVIEGNITIFKIVEVLKAEFNDITFENANYSAEYCFKDFILYRIKISYPSE